MNKISVIIPMYNAEDTIVECLSSLVEQTIFSDMEILIVDDHSSDGCVNKVLVFEEKYPDKIMLIRLSENGGPGKARNIAMEYAQGEYIGFVDSDDAVVTNMYELLYNEAIRTEADVVDGGIFNQTKDEAILYTSDDLTGLTNVEKINTLIVSGGYICSKIFKREFLISNGISFRDEYILEDLDYIMEVFCKMDRISNVKEILYIYRNSEDSLSKTIDVEKYVHSTTTAIRSIYERLSGLSFYNGIRDAVEYVMIRLYSYSVNINIKAFKDKVRTGSSVLESLHNLRKLRFQYIIGGYGNHYVSEKIDGTDIAIMEKNDMSPDELLKGYLSAKRSRAEEINPV